MPSKTISISSANWERVKKAFHDFIPQDTDGNPLYTDAEWVFVYIKRLVARKVRSYELDRVGHNNVPPQDDDIVKIA